MHIELLLLYKLARMQLYAHGIIWLIAAVTDYCTVICWIED